MIFTTDEEYKEQIQKFEIESRQREAKVKQILLDKLEEMAEMPFDYCENEYPEICKAMNDIANTILKLI